MLAGKVNGSNKAKILNVNSERGGDRAGRRLLASLTEGGAMAEGYCVKCKSKREMKDAEEVEMKNKRKALKGTCEKCGTKMFRILGKS